MSAKTINADKTDVAENTETRVRVKRKPISCTIPEDQYDALEGFAFGTRRRLSQVFQAAVSEYLDNHADEIKEKFVV